jgi:hypothetical protein
MDGILSHASEDTAQWIAATMRGKAPKTGAKVVVDQDAKTMV